jgi:hypothetical protein
VVVVFVVGIVGTGVDVVGALWVVVAGGGAGAWVAVDAGPCAAGAGAACGGACAVVLGLLGMVCGLCVRLRGAVFCACLTGVVAAEVVVAVAAGVDLDVPELPQPAMTRLAASEAGRARRIKMGAEGARGRARPGYKQRQRASAA